MNTRLIIFSGAERLGGGYFVTKRGEGGENITHHIKGIGEVFLQDIQIALNFQIIFLNSPKR